MPESVALLNDLLVFVVGRPGTGKTTLVRYLTRSLASTKTLSLNDYDMLTARIDHLAPAQISREQNGQFEILDRTLFDSLLQELARAVASNRGKRPIIVEFSRPEYVSAFASLQELTKGSYHIVYLDAPLEECIQRNALRSPYNPIKTIPEGVIRRYYSGGDVGALLKAHPGHVRVINTTAVSLHELEREAALLLGELVGERHVIPLRPGGQLVKELVAAVLLLFFLLLFTGVALFGWGVQDGVLELLAPLSASERNFVSTVLYVIAAGGLGSTTYCIRALYTYYIKGIFDFDRFKWWYVFRPLTGAVLAVCAFAIVQGGGIVLGSGTSNFQPTTATNLTWFGIAYLAGFGTEGVIEWLRRGSKTVFGESRVQPEEEADG